MNNYKKRMKMYHQAVARKKSEKAKYKYILIWKGSFVCIKIEVPNKNLNFTR